MPRLPKLLTTRHLLSDDVGKAAEEAFRNAQRLIQAGQFAAAYQVFAAMLVPGPWRTSKGSDWRFHLLWHVWWLEARLGVGPVLDAQAEAAEAHAKDVREYLRATVPSPALGVDYWDQVLKGGSGQARPKTWTAAEMAQALAGLQPERRSVAFSTFRDAAEAELKRRVRERALGNAADPGDHGAIADTIERGETAIWGPRESLTCFEASATAAAVIDVLSGDPAAATARLSRTWPKLVPEFLVDEWRIPAFADYLASGALGPALGIDAAGAQAYLEAFATRTAYTVAAVKPRPWKQVLKAWVERLREDGLDGDALAYALDAGSPACKPLVARAKKGNPLNVPVKDADLAALEARIGMPLPPSYREFLQATDGLVVPNFLALLPAAQVAWLHELEPGTVAAWNDGDTDAEAATDEQYAVYGADQDCIHMRPAHLRQALMVSAAADGDVLLLVPAVRFGEEWEAWHLGAKNPGAYRFRSFRALMEQKVLVDE
jgi:hypothetical protein